jgi:flavin-dependent dehydrogenase
VRPGTYAWVRMILDPRTTRAEVPPELSGMTPVGRPSRGADVTWRMAAAPAGPGYILVGDACAVLDPAASHGILRALVSGMFAARATTAELTGRSPRGRAAGEYRTLMTEWFRHDVVRLGSLYQVFGSWR